MRSHVRAFVALDLPAALRAGLGGAVERMRPGLPGIRWVPPASLHVTLRFLGWSPPLALARVAAALRAAAASTPPLDAHVAGLGLFPERGRVRVLWIGLRLPPPAFELQAACERAAVAAGYAPEGRPFAAHLTLGRWKQPVLRPPLPEVNLGAARLSRLVLFRSRLLSTGPEYTPIESFPLGQR